MSKEIALDEIKKFWPEKAPDINLVQKYVGIDQIIDKLVKKLGDVQAAYIIGDYARGLDSGLIDIVLVGNINTVELDKIANKQEKVIERKIRSLVLSINEIKNLWLQLGMNQALLIWGQPIQIEEGFSEK